MATRDALQLASEAGLELVEVNAKASPPVCKILDYGKFKYENAKREREAKKNKKSQELKEVKFRPKTHDHDFDFKTKHVRRFLEEGNKVRLLIQFRGREVTHPETGRAQLEKVCKEVADIATVIQIAQMEGNRMSMILSPRPNRNPKPKVEKAEEAPKRERRQVREARAAAEATSDEGGDEPDEMTEDGVHAPDAESTPEETVEKAETAEATS